MMNEKILFKEIILFPPEGEIKPEHGFTEFTNLKIISKQGSGSLIQFMVMENKPLMGRVVGSYIIYHQKNLLNDVDNMITLDHVHMSLFGTDGLNPFIYADTYYDHGEDDLIEFASKLTIDDFGKLWHKALRIDKGQSKPFAWFDRNNVEHNLFTQKL